MTNNLKTRKMYYAGHIMRNTSGHYDTLLRTLEGRRQTRNLIRETKTNMGRQSNRLEWPETIRPDRESS